jgi:hypothetical protein
VRHRTAKRQHAAGPLQSVRDFFFAEEVPYGLAAVRIVLPLVLLADLLRRWPFARELFSADGATAPLWITYGFRSPLPELPGAVAVGLFTLLLAALVASSLGWMTRVSLTIATVLYFYFTTLDAIGTITKYTVIACHVLLLLSFSHCGAVCSLDALRRPIAGPRFPVWPRRLIQIFIGVVYLGAAMTKMHTPSYFNGDQMLWWMLTHVNGRHPIGEYLAYFPVILTIGAYAAVLWEVMFLFLAWRGWSRALMLLIGVGFHISTWLTLGLDVFPCVMISTYLCFFGERDYYAVSRWVNRLATRWNVPVGEFLSAAVGWLAPTRRLGPVGFVVTLWSIALAGTAAEYWMDPYGVRRPDGPLALRELDPATVQTMLNRTQVLRPQDRIFSFELGTGTFGEWLTGRKRVFSKGEELIAQCIPAPPHFDCYLECNLHSADGRVLERVGRILARENSRMNFHFTLCDAVEPGEYELVLKLSGTEVARRRFTVVEENRHASRRDDATAVPGLLAR